MKKLLIALTTLVAVFVLVIFYFLQHGLPTTNGQIVLNGLHGDVYIQRDQHGVPHILAKKHDNDAYYALGFAHAQDRFWQMEFQRHVVSGRLSELFGKEAIDKDRYLRTWGFYRAAQAAFPALDNQSKSIINAYTAGVNAFIRLKHFPMEITVLNHKVQPWTAVDSIAWQKMMAWDLQSSWEEKIKNYMLAKQFGRDQISVYKPPYPEQAPTVLTKQAMAQSSLAAPTHTYVKEVDQAFEQFANAETTPLTSTQNMRQSLGFSQGPSVGSNNWVVSGKHTVTGKPMIADDVHLSLGLPNLWYVAEMKGPSLHVVGATIPGLPGVIIGHNQHIAWAVTNGSNDAMDLFFVNDQVPTTTREETINVRDADPVKITITETSKGPVISDVTPEIKKLGIRLALQWPALQANDTTVQSFVKIAYAKNWQDFTEALRDFITPTQNFLYADQDNNIGYYFPGKLPIRRNFSGTTPVPFNFNWDGYIPFEQLPHSYNPESGILVSANNKVVPFGYPYDLTFRWKTPPYRAERILHLLQHNKPITIDDMKQVQNDVYSQFWQSLKPLLLDLAVDKDDQAAFKRLMNWSGYMTKDSVGATLFAVWVDQLSQYYPQDIAFGEKWFSPLYLIDSIKNKRISPQQLSDSFAAAVTFCQQQLGDDIDDWQWGRLHQASFKLKGLGESRLFAWLFNRNINTSGGNYTVNDGTFDAKTFTQITGATYRQIISLDDMNNNSWFMHTTGQSGHLLSQHYDDFLPLWQQGKYLKLSMQAESCEPEQVNCLLLLKR